jgi:phosphate transport system permease protein
VPSIVFGVFGLGFFVYFMGGSIDRLFFSDALPTPTFGTGGILWASLTLALLTVPVVIVASEEALAAVPRSMREASLAMGATKFQTILRVVLPAGRSRHPDRPHPGHGARRRRGGAADADRRREAGTRAAARRLVPVLPLRPQVHAPGLPHLRRRASRARTWKAAKPMVYTTTIFLLMIVVALNFTAIVVRNRLRRKFQTSAF